MASRLCQELLTSIFEHVLSDVDPTNVDSSRSSNTLAKPTSSPQGTLCTAARVCRSWNAACTKLLYSDPGPCISRYEGLYLPHLIDSLRRHQYLRECVRAVTITASLEAGLWVSDYACEGDLFAQLVELCPRLRGM